MKKQATLEVTQSQFDRAHADFVKESKEGGTTELVNGVFYFYGSEVATLRLLKAYRLTNKANQDYSKNLSSFFFSLETGFVGDFSS